MSTKPPPDSDSRRQTRRISIFRPAPQRARLASKVERVLATALNGDPRVMLDVKAAELLADADAVAEVISAAMARAGSGLTAQLTITQTFHRTGLDGDLLDSLASPDPSLRIAGARLCGALRLPDAVPWLADLLDDPERTVREVAVRALGQVGGRRVVQTLMSHADRLPRHRVAIELARAASDVDLESLLREPGDTKTTVTVLMACGLRRDVLRGPLLVTMAQDRECETEVRVAACRAVAMMGNPAGAHALRTLANDPDETVRAAAMRARMRISATTRKRLA